jgi:ATP citrate (pro-S)-lyase
MSSEADSVGPQVRGPDSFITEIVPLALGVQKTKSTSASLKPPTGESIPTGMVTPVKNQGNGLSSTASAAVTPADESGSKIVSFDDNPVPAQRPWFRPFDENTRCFVYGLQPRAIQGMLDFDFACGRKTPSVAAIVYEFGSHHIQVSILRIDMHGADIDHLEILLGIERDSSSGLHICS